LAVTLLIHAEAQNSDTRSELWQEVDIHVPINEKIRLIFSVSTTGVRTSKSNLAGQVGAYIDYTVNRRLVLRSGYRYGFSLGESDPSREHRLILDQTFRQSAPVKVLLSDRNREEFRFINGSYSFRYRNRLTVEREFRFMGRSLTPYAAAEVFHDSRFDLWNRNRLTAGVQIHLKRSAPLLKLIYPRRRVVLDFYYTRQNDIRSEPHHINALGVTFGFYF